MNYHNKFPLILILFFLSLISVKAFGGNDWPMYQSDYQHSGVSDSPAPDGQILWTFNTSSYLYEQPLVWNEKVYFSTSQGTFYCLDAYTGDIIWVYETNQVMSSQPTLYDGKVYFATYDNNVYSLDANNGDFLWSFNVTEHKGSSSLTPFVTHPVGYENKLYFGIPSGYFFSLDANTGKILWTTENLGDKIVYGFNNYIPVIHEDRIYVGTHSGTIFSLDTLTGEKYWSYKTTSSTGRSPSISGTPLIYDNTLILQSGGNDYFINLVSGKIEVSFDSSIPISSVYNDMIIGVGYTGITWYDYNSKQYLGKFKTESRSSTPVIASEQIYFGDMDGNFYSVSTETRELLWVTQLNSKINGPASIWNGRIYVGTYGGILYCLGTGDEPFKKTSSIIVEQPERNLFDNSWFWLNGSISPDIHNGDNKGVKIIITYEKPSGVTESEWRYDQWDSTFSHQFSVDEPGEWAVSVKWAGNLEYYGAESEWITFNVESIEPEETQQTGSIFITVKNSDGQPVEGVNLSSKEKPENQGDIIGVSDTEGKFDISDIYVGEYILEFSKSGYDLYRVNVEVTQNVKTGIRIVLKEISDNSNKGPQSEPEPEPEPEQELEEEIEKKGIPGFPYISIILGLVIVLSFRRFLT